MRVGFLAVLLAGTMLNPMAKAQSGKPALLHLYDNFNQAFLDPSKWIGTWQCGSPAMESVREIENGQLRLRVRTVEN